MSHLHSSHLVREARSCASGLRTGTAGFRSLTENIDTTTSGGKCVFHIFGVLAEFERELIRERTHAGLAAARPRGRNGGAAYCHASRKVAAARQMYDSKQYTVEAIAKVLGVSRASIYRHLGSPAATTESDAGKAAPTGPPPKPPRKPRPAAAGGS